MLNYITLQPYHKLEVDLFEKETRELREYKILVTDNNSFWTVKAHDELPIHEFKRHILTKLGKIFFFEEDLEDYLEREVDGKKFRCVKDLYYK